MQTFKDFLVVLACSSYSPSNPSLTIIQQFYSFAIASTEPCELVNWLCALLARFDRSHHRSATILIFDPYIVIFQIFRPQVRG